MGINFDPQDTDEFFSTLVALRVKGLPTCDACGKDARYGYPNSCTYCYGCHSDPCQKCSCDGTCGCNGGCVRECDCGGPGLPGDGFVIEDLLAHLI